MARAVPRGEFSGASGRATRVLS